MTQRNPMNDRYQSDPPKGQTKRSASSLKPKTKAASSVYVRSTEKTPQEKKAIQREQRQKRRELDSLYYNPPTEEYKRLRRMWWVFLVIAIVLTCAAMFIPSLSGDNSVVTWMLLIPAYACILIALWLDLYKIRRVRRLYQEEMVKRHPKEVKKHAGEYAAKAQAKAEAMRRDRHENGIGAKIKGVFGVKKQEEPAVEEASANKSAEKTGEDTATQEDAHKPIAQLKAEREAAKKAEKRSSAAEASATAAEKAAPAKETRT